MLKYLDSCLCDIFMVEPVYGLLPVLLQGHDEGLSVFRFFRLLSALFHISSSVLCCRISVFSHQCSVLHPLHFVLNPLPTKLCSMPCPISDRSWGAVPLGAGTIKAQLDCMIRGQQVQDCSGTILYPY